MARIPLAAQQLAETPCTDVLGLVIYDLPGRDGAERPPTASLQQANSQPTSPPTLTQLLLPSRPLPMLPLLRLLSLILSLTWSPT
jgi:hypothetical protein